MTRSNLTLNLPWTKGPKNRGFVHGTVHGGQGLSTRGQKISKTLKRNNKSVDTFCPRPWTRKNLSTPPPLLEEGGARDCTVDKRLFQGSEKQEKQRSNQMLPILDFKKSKGLVVDFDSPPPLGTIVEFRKGRLRKLVKVEPYVRKTDGAESFLLTWQGLDLSEVTTGLRSKDGVQK